MHQRVGGRGWCKWPVQGLIAETGVSTLFESGRIVDLILGLMLLEALVICFLGLALRYRLPVPGLLFNLAAGAALLLALRAVLSNAGWHVVGMWLICALLAHVGDLLLRLRRR